MIRGAHGHVDRQRGFWGQPKREANMGANMETDAIVAAVRAAVEAQLEQTTMSTNEVRFVLRHTRTFVAATIAALRAGVETDEQTRRYLRGIPDDAPF